ncbi:RNA polymerase sigma-70 factor, ECF subfamily [Pseudarcicella hirudinis]|uniref:RNA polymerase sigma-70 factor, ECF subfamily n=1 Tax=Pseudarcicella hirudinis TaxID=1079859 RepID=A0A1I5WAS4_9BACT|nr:sigma-70 family RNA polymerase sigma factor [Pseudarcicella hirudinis]SFQ16781.1 RNA polymerase sigma-70 factor, ECF subfamily [Pseudarcicella hirudinis]
MNLDLWQKARFGDKEAFCQLCENHYKILFNYATSFTKDRELIKDQIQDLFLYLWEQRNTINEIRVITIYLIKALRNNLLQHLRRNQWNILNDNFTEDLNFFEEMNAETSLISHEIYSQNEQRIRQAIALLPKRQQEVLFLKFYQGLDHQQIADLMDINKQSVSNLLQKALITLRTLFPNNWQFWSFLLFSLH